MKVLLQSRTTLFSGPGGDTVQVVKTAEALRALGCQVDISTELEPELAGYDLVHLFNLIRPQEVYLQARNAKRQHKPVALSTIYVDYSEFDRQGRTGLARVAANLLNPWQLEYLKVLARALKNRESNKGTWQVLRRGYRNLQVEILQMSDVLLPNSASEMRRVAADFPESRRLSHVVVPNAVDAQLFGGEAVPSAETAPFQGCVLCVGRIEGRKCQLNLVRAMRDLPWRLVLVGQPGPNHLDYYRQLQAEAGPNVTIIGQLDHHQLPALYAAAKVHCLVSWMETTGLSSLEAAAMGCQLVITDKGDTRDYFADLAWYCEPDSVASIRDAIVEAYRAPADARLRERVLENYTWEKTAEKTLEGYRQAIEAARTGGKG